MRRIVNVFLAAVVLAALACASALAQDQDPRAELREKVQKFLALNGELPKLFVDKKWDEVIVKCKEMSELIPQEPSPYYNLACCYARLGQTEKAFENLKLSAERGFAEADHMRKDDDLESLRKDKRFDEIVAKVAENEKKTIDQAGPIEGVKTVEDLPEGGLRYRLRMSPDATKEKPNRLIVWMHPSGGSMNSVVESLAPRFIGKGFALMVMTQKQWAGWMGPEGERLMGKTLPAVGKIPGINADRPILMGFSAGGQMALEMWKLDPARYGGLILDAAYPVTRTETGQMAVMKLPEADAVKRTPIFAVVGEKDNLAPLWKRVGPEWRKAGVPLRVDFVPNAGHQWLFGRFQLAALDAWLSDIAAGKMPEVPEDKPAVEAEKKPEATTPPTPDGDLKPEPPELAPR